MDTLTKQQRSELMAKVRARGNRSTELRFVKFLRKWRLRGWRRGQRLAGQPDFVFMQAKLAIFIDGCFWHGCKLHCRMPAANHSYWLKKVSRNKLRDRLVTRALRRANWRVLRIWEHTLQWATQKPQNEARLVERLKFFMKKRRH